MQNKHGGHRGDAKTDCQARLSNAVLVEPPGTISAARHVPTIETERHWQADKCLMTDEWCGKSEGAIDECQQAAGYCYCKR
jgi:hypothetical protein